MAGAGVRGQAEQVEMQVFPLQSPLPAGSPRFPRPHSTSTVVGLTQGTSGTWSAPGLGRFIVFCSGSPHFLPFNKQTQKWGVDGQGRGQTSKAGFRHGLKSENLVYEWMVGKVGEHWGSRLRALCMGWPSLLGSRHLGNPEVPWEDGLRRSLPLASW